MSKTLLSTDNYSILGGELYFKATGETAWQPLGNAPAFTYTPTLETIEHFSSQGGLQELDKELISQVGADLTLTLDETVAFNLSLAVLGDLSDLNQAGGTGSTFNVTGVEAGKAYDIGEVDLSNVTVEDGVQSVTYTEGTDYVIDLASGTFRVIQIPGGADSDLLVTYDSAAHVSDRQVVSALTSTQLEGAFMYVGKNDIGNKFKFIIEKAQFLPGGDVNFINEGGSDINTIELSGKALKNQNDVNFPYGKIIELN